MSHPRGLDILVVTHEYPRPDVAASNRRLVDVLAMLAKGCRVGLLCPKSTMTDVEPRYESLYRSMGVVVTFFEGERELDRHLLRRVYDVVFFEWWVTAPGAVEAVRRRQPWATIVVDAVDVCYRREEAAAAVGQMDAATVAENRRREIAAYRGADSLFAVTDEDLSALRENGLEQPIFLVPMIEPIRPRPAIARDRELLFVGTFGINPANVDGVLWFVGEVWPSVRAAVPEARLTLVGSKPGPEIRELSRIPGIDVTGFVPDLGIYLDRAAVSIAPLRFGGGMKGKVTEAMASGLPLVATRFGAQGLGVTPGEHMIVADDAEAFALGVRRLLEDEEYAERIGRSGQKFITDVCSPEAVGIRIDEFLTWAANRRRRSRWSMFGWKTRSAVVPVVDSFSIRRVVGQVRRRIPGKLRNGLKAWKARLRQGGDRSTS